MQAADGDAVCTELCNQQTTCKEPQYKYDALCIQRMARCQKVSRFVLMLTWDKLTGKF
jgi:hypothetical protein